MIVHIMFTRFTKISLFFLLLALSGMVGTTLHYHTETLECLEHGNAAHVSSNTLLCPVHALTLNNYTPDCSVSRATLTYTIPQFLFSESALVVELSYSKFGRAPPFMV